MTKSCILSQDQALALAMTGRWPGMIQKPHATVAMQNVSDEEAKLINTFFLRQEMPVVAWEDEVAPSSPKAAEDPPLEPTAPASDAASEPYSSEPPDSSKDADRPS